MIFAEFIERIYRNYIIKVKEPSVKYFVKNLKIMRSQSKTSFLDFDRSFSVLKWLNIYQKLKIDKVLEKFKNP